MLIGIAIYLAVAMLFYSYLLITACPEVQSEGAGEAPSSHLNPFRR